jgi:hypothetical protein
MASARRNGRALLALAILLLLPAILFAAYTWITLHVSSATGERTGYVQKISRNGRVARHGRMTTVAGTAPQIFAFSPE